MRRQKLKTPEDYPLMSFRVSSVEKKEELAMQLRELTKQFNAKVKDGERSIKQYEVFQRALETGLAFLKKEGKL